MSLPVIPFHTMYDLTTVGTLALGCIVVAYTAKRAFASRTSYPLPPGPPGLPWVGNVIGIDAGAPWKTYAEWAQTYGGLQHVQFYIIYSTRYPCRRYCLFSSVRKGYHHHQLGKDCKGLAGESI